MRYDAKNIGKASYSIDISFRIGKVMPVVQYPTQDSRKAAAQTPTWY